MSDVIRIFVEKREGFNVVAKQTLWDIRHNLGMRSVTDLRYIVRYDMEGLTKEEYDKFIETFEKGKTALQSAVLTADRKKNYGKSVQNMYRRKGSLDKLLFILSAEDFAQSYRRMRYLKEYLIIMVKINLHGYFIEHWKCHKMMRAIQV